MTNRKLGVYELVPINGSVMIGNGKSISCTHRGKMDVIFKHKDGSLARETWEVKIVPELNHDLFSFTKAMKDGWQMNGRWKEGGLMIELFKTGRASMKFDRMIPSGSSWLMGIKVLRVYDEAHVIQFPPEMDETWVRYGLAKLGQISELPNWQRMLFCAYTTQLLLSTGEVCWNNKDSYFIWFEFVCRNSGQIASRRSWKRSCLGLEYTSKCSRLALLWEPN